MNDVKSLITEKNQVVYNDVKITFDNTFFILYYRIFFLVFDILNLFFFYNQRLVEMPIPIRMETLASGNAIIL